MKIINMNDGFLEGEHNHRQLKIVIEHGELSYVDKNIRMDFLTPSDKKYISDPFRKPSDFSREGQYKYGDVVISSGVFYKFVNTDTGISGVTGTVTGNNDSRRIDGLDEIQEWEDGTVYNPGDVVIYNTGDDAKIYFCTSDEGHEAAAGNAPEVDNSPWEEITSVWAGSTSYTKGAYVFYENEQYVCLKSHTSGDTFSGKYWKKHILWNRITDGYIEEGKDELDQDIYTIRYKMPNPLFDKEGILFAQVVVTETDGSFCAKSPMYKYYVDRSVEGGIFSEIDTDQTGLLSLIGLKDELDKAIKSQLFTVDPTLTKEMAGADAKAVGDILFGGSDHTGKTPWSEVNYSPAMEQGEKIDIRDMPKYSFVYKHTSLLDSLPQGVNSGTVFVTRRPINQYGNVSLFSVYVDDHVNNQFEIDREYIGTYIEGDQNGIVWREVPVETDTSLSVSQKPADAKTVGDILFGGSDHTGKTPWSEVFFSPVIEDGETFDIMDMPRFSFMYTSPSKLSNLPTEIGNGMIFVMRRPINNSNISLFTVYKVAYSAQNGRKLVIKKKVIGTYIEGEGKIAWTEIPIDTYNTYDYDWILTDFEEHDKWYLNNGSLSDTTTVKHSQFIPVYPGQVLYGAWWTGNYAFGCGGAIFNKNKEWIAPITFPYTSGGEEHPGSDFVEECSYDKPNVITGSADITFSKMFKITIPSVESGYADDGWYVVLNRATSSTSDTQSLSTLPMIGSTDTGNRIWRKDDPQRAIKKGKKLYIIGPSTAAINRGYRRIYEANELINGTDPTTVNQNVAENFNELYNALPIKVICGFQEYLIPYYDEIVTLGFSGKSQTQIYNYLSTGNYIGYNDNTLGDADEVVIMSNSNGAGNAAVIGSETDNNENTYCGAINKLIDLIYNKNSRSGAADGHGVRIYLSTGFVRGGEGTTAYEMCLLRNEKIRAIARRRNIGIIEEAYSGVNYENYAYFTYDSWINTQTQPYSPYGMHLNNEGNRILGNIFLQALLNDGDDIPIPDINAISNRFEQLKEQLEQDVYISDEIITGDFLKVEWTPHRYVSNIDGGVNYTDQNYSATENMIRVPYGSSLVIHSLASVQNPTRIVTYDEDGEFIAYESHTTPFDFCVHYTDAAFVRIQYAHADDNITANSDYINARCFIRVSYADGDVVHQDSVNSKLDDSVYESITDPEPPAWTGRKSYTKGAVVSYNNNQYECLNNHTSGDAFDPAYWSEPRIMHNPIVLKNTSHNKFKSLVVPFADENTKLTVCGKNIFNIRDYANILGNYSGGACNIEKNNVRFIFIPSTGAIRILSVFQDNAYQQASASTTSASDALGSKYSKINNTVFYHNFKFKFPVDTVVSVSDNAIDSDDYFPPASSGRTSVVTPVHLPFNTGVQMRIYDGTKGDNNNIIDTSYRVINGGVSFTAKANTEYGVYFVVQEGWRGDITFRPQIEIGSHITAYETYSGYELNNLDSSQPTDDNLFVLPDSDSSVIVSDKDNDGVNDLNVIFDSNVNEIYISSDKTNSTGSKVIAPTTHTNTMQPGEAAYIAKFTGDGGYVLISGIPRTADRAVVAQIFPVDENDLSSITGVSYDVGDGAYILTKQNKQYKYRILVRNDAEFKGSIRPIIARGRSALAIAKSFNGITTLYTNDGSSISVTAAAMRNSESIVNSAKIAERINIITGGRILDGPEKRRPMISFIDDDTTSLDLVKEYHTVCSTAGLDNSPILGGFAVEAQHLIDDETQRLNSQWVSNTSYTAGSYVLYNNMPYQCVTTHTSGEEFDAEKWRLLASLDEIETLKSVLLSYDKEGYACLYHCLEQVSTNTDDNTWYWVDNPDYCVDTKPSGVVAYNETKTRQNFVDGLLAMREFGFINWQYWVTPYGVNNEFMQSLAKQYGMKCLVSFQSRITEFNSFVSRYGNVGKWDIPRFHYYYDENIITGSESWPYSYKDLKLKNIIDATVADKGWLIVTTHVNTWPSNYKVVDGTTVYTGKREEMKNRFKGLVRYAQTAGMDVVPFQVGFETFKPYLDMHDLLK